MVCTIQETNAGETMSLIDNLFMYINMIVSSGLCVVLCISLIEECYRKLYLPQINTKGVSQTGF